MEDLGIKMRMITGKLLQSLNMNILPYADVNVQVTFPVPKGQDYLYFGILINKDLAYGVGVTDLLHLFLLRDGTVLLEMKKPLGIVGDNVRELFGRSLDFFIGEKLNPVLVNNPYMAKRTRLTVGESRGTSVDKDKLKLINIFMNREVVLANPLKMKDIQKRIKSFRK